MLQEFLWFTRQSFFFLNFLRPTKKNAHFAVSLLPSRSKIKNENEITLQHILCCVCVWFSCVCVLEFFSFPPHDQIIIFCFFTKVFSVGTSPESTTVDGVLDSVCAGSAPVPQIQTKLNGVHEKVKMANSCEIFDVFLFSKSKKNCL